MGQQEGPLVSIHDVLAFLSDFDSLPDPRVVLSDSLLSPLLRGLA